jgi:glycosyltransferase involved in cell wall biosynthesis
MTPGLVSVVIAAYQEQAFIAQALRSVQAQTYRPLELIVVDDGSTDRTAEIATAHAAHILKRPHLGPSAARNTGLEAATGQYWTVFDADDVMPPDRITHQINHLQQHPQHDIVLGLTKAFINPGEPRPPHYNPTWDNGPFAGHPGTMLARREVLRAVGAFDERLQLGEDLEWQARAKDAGVRAGHIDQLCLYYRIHQANTSSDTEANRRATLNVLRESLHRRRTQGADVH